MNRDDSIVKRRERRRDRRRALQLEAQLGGLDVVLSDLSAVGFGAAIDATDRRPHDFRIGQSLRLDLHLKNGETFSFSVEIVRPMAENGVVGGVFVNLTDEGYNVIESLLTGRFNRRR
jgi:hypothetical protein